MKIKIAKVLNCENHSHGPYACIPMYTYQCIWARIQQHSLSQQILQDNKPMYRYNIKCIFASHEYMYVTFLIWWATPFWPDTF